MLDKLQQFTKKYIPDPRKDSKMARPVGYEDFKTSPVLKQRDSAEESVEEKETLELYMKKRNENWIKANREFSGLGNLAAQLGLPEPKDGGVLQKVGDSRSQYMTFDAMEKTQQEMNAHAVHIDEEKVRLRRELQVRNEEEFRQEVAERKRAELRAERESRRRLPHPADPKYDPFKATPGYRPSDSRKLADWLVKQRATGKTASGLDLNTREGQDRWYNEEKMATQDFANPYATRVEVPRGGPRVDIGAMSPDSFFIDGKEVIGSVLCTPTRYYHWNAKTFEDINEDSLSLLLHTYPVPDILFVGTGRNQHMLPEELKIKFQKRGTILYSLTSKEAASQFTLQLSMKRRVSCALLACVPTNPYGTECFGDFIENDHWTLSDFQLGISPWNRWMPEMYERNNVAEKYRHMQGTGYGPKYHELSDGRLVRPGRHGTKLHPMIEPGEEIDWENLPSYYGWYPKERLSDYIENTTYRETRQKEGTTDVALADTRYKSATFEGRKMQAEGEQPVGDIMPWDSESIPITTHQGLKGHDFDPDLRSVIDPSVGRAVHMHKNAFEAWKEMMRARREGRKSATEVEFDQESLSSDADGVLYDHAKIRYRPHMHGMWHPRNQMSTGFRGSKNQLTH